MPYYVVLEIADFNPRSREGSDAVILYHKCIFRNFNPRSREGSDVSQSYISPPPFINFNPRSREGSDQATHERYDIFRISIHAPAKGATVYLNARAHLHLFQSTLPRRERHVWLGRLRRLGRFQSTLPRRERRIFRWKDVRR